jgi:phosphoribosylformylglycinamidine synthase
VVAENSFLEQKENMDRKVNAETAAEMGLHTGEFQMICEQLGRDPSYSELLIFAVMWSEEFSCKNSFHWLKTLPIQGKKVINRDRYPYQSFLEVEPGKGLCLELSTSDPWFGLAPEMAAQAQVLDTVGGMLSRKARPLAFCNTLGMGKSKDKLNKPLVQAVWNATSVPERSMDIPTVENTTILHTSYRQNKLFNLTLLGLPISVQRAGSPRVVISSFYPIPSGTQGSLPL